MRKSSLLFSIALSCLSLTSALSIIRHSNSPSKLRMRQVENGTIPKLLVPDEDSFYKATKGFESAKLGDILSHRKVPNPISFNNKDPITIKAAWQIQYRTQNSVGDPEANTLTVLVPFNPKPKHLFSLSYFSDASWNGCNPSINLQVGSPKDSSFTQFQTLLAVAALTEGWYVVIPDDGGPQAAFSAGPQMAFSILDAMRAVKKSGKITDIDPDPIITMFGYSGGGVAAAWATEMQPGYAPDVKIAGAALGGLIPNMSYAFEIYNKEKRSNFIPPGLLGMSHDYRNLSKWLDENLKPELASEFRKADHQCFDSNEKMFIRQDMGKYFKRGWSSVFEGIPNEVIQWAGTLGIRGPPKVPWYLYETAWDDVSPVAVTDALFKNHCEKGANILYERNAFLALPHAVEAFYGITGAFTWLQDRNNGDQIYSGCFQPNVTGETVKGALNGVLFKKLYGIYQAYMGNPITSVERFLQTDLLENFN